ncbi:MAG TPA: efflux RND transporter periplasmic adaptor subunit [Anaeromyxobacteraceae bacterium]|nr:efflux RND transporter periplasmic adaptor subunit [Anaeromyxobacteraceae bacterium]
MRTRAAVLLVATVALACGERPAPAPPAAPAGEVWLNDKQVADARIGVEEARVRPVDAPVVAPARIAFNDLKVVHVFSPVAGRVTRVVAHPGERVRKGATLAVVHSPDVGQAVADLARAHADLVLADQEERRQKELFEARAGARRDLETAVANAAKARAEFGRADEKARLLRSEGLTANQEFEIKSPLDGNVIARAITPGMELQGQYAGGQAVELFTIGDPDAVWVLADVFAIDLPRLAVGAPARVTLPAFPGRTFGGKLAWIAGALDPASHAARIRVTLDDPGGDLRPEMLGTVEIAGRARDALAVPRSALLRLGEGWVVFVEQGRSPDGRTRFVRRSVEIEDDGGDVVAVVRGLTPGEKVASTGAILLLGML